MASARERLLAAITGTPGAPVPCSFMIFRALRARVRDEFEFARGQAELGLDARVQLDDFPVRFSREVTVREWSENGLLHRAYDTPAGSLTASAKRTEDWPYGGSIPIFDDYFTPRAVKYPVTGPQDLEALRYLLAPPRREDVSAFRAQAATRKRFAQEHGFLFTGGWKSQRFVEGERKELIGDNGGTGTVIDTLMWLCGGTAPLLWAYDEPAFLAELIALVESWNRARLELHLAAGPDLVVRRAWYEGTEFWSPALWRRFILPGMKREAQLIHQAGARFGYLLTSGLVPLADLILESGVDVIIGIDPGEGKGTTLEQVARSFGGRTGLWGGVSGPLVVEEGDERDVQHAVIEAMRVLAPTGRFILSPVDNVRADTDRAWRNVKRFISMWKALAKES